MILRAAIVFLLMLNLGVAAWWLGGDHLTAAAPAAVADVKQPGLRLVNEPMAAKPVVALQGDASSETAQLATPVATATTTPENPAESPSGVPSETSIATAEAALCLSFGPFDDAAARDAVRPSLQARAQKVVARETRAKSARGWRVYMPALASREAAQEVVAAIKTAGISDWYIIANGSEANSIALGRYGGEESARRRQAQLAAKGFTARAESLGDTPSQWWLDARFAADAGRAGLAAIAPSKPLDCARLR